MWEFVRSAKAHPDIEGLNAFEAFSVLEQCLKSWEVEGKGDIWKSLFPASDDPKEEFLYTWERVKWPRNELSRARASAQAFPLKPERCYSQKYGEFISLAGHLQREVSGSILLPCLKLSEMLRCAPMAVSRYRTWAQADGLLRLTRRGIKAQRKADEFVFAVEQFDWDSGNQISENLNLCLTSPPKCYTEIQEIERKEETQERQEKKETHEMQREARARLREKRKCVLREGPYIPTTAELEQELQETAHLRGVP
jgi:hypothetical protein